MICKNCSKEIPDGAQFCPNCGNRVPEEAKQIPSENALPSAETPIKQEPEAEQEQAASAKFRINRKTIILAVAIVFLAGFVVWFFDFFPEFRFWESPHGLFARAERFLQNAEYAKGVEYLVQADRRARDNCSLEERPNLRLQIMGACETYHDKTEGLPKYPDYLYCMGDILSFALYEEECEDALKALDMKYEIVEGQVWAHTEDNRYYSNLYNTGSGDFNMTNVAQLGFWSKTQMRMESAGKSGIFDEKGYYYAESKESGLSRWDLCGNEQELIDTEYGAELIGLEDGYIYYLDDDAIYRIPVDETQQRDGNIRRQTLVSACESFCGAALLDGYLYYVKKVAEGDGYAGRLFRCLSDGKQEEQITGDLPLQYVSTGEVVKWEDQDIKKIFSADGGIMMALDNNLLGATYIKYRLGGETTVYCTDGYYFWTDFDNYTYSDDTGFYHIGYEKDDGEETEETYKLCRIIPGSNRCETLRSDIGETESVLYHSGDWVVVAKDRQMLKVINISTGAMGEISISEEEGEFDDSCAIVDDTLFCTGINDLDWSIYRVDLKQINEGITKLSLEKCPEESDFGYPCFLGEARENGQSYCLYSGRDGNVRRLKTY